MQTFPSQRTFPLLWTEAGMVVVSISWVFTRIPSGDRKPTMILGTPSRKDWIQNFISLRSKLSMSRSDRISTDVLSSTQLMGGPGGLGFESHTVEGADVVRLRDCDDGYETRTHSRRLLLRGILLTCRALFGQPSNIAHCYLPHGYLVTRCSLAMFRPMVEALLIRFRICILECEKKENCELHVYVGGLWSNRYPRTA